MSAVALRVFTDRCVSCADRTTLGRATADAKSFLQREMEDLKAQIVTAEAQLAAAAPLTWADQILACVSDTSAVGQVVAQHGSDTGVGHYRAVKIKARLRQKLGLIELDLATRTGRGHYLTTRDVVKFIVKPATDAQLCRYVELAEWATGTDAEGRPFVGDADYFVSHSWDSPWKELVLAVEAHQARHPLQLFYYWVDIVAVCQHCETADHNAGSPGKMLSACGPGCAGCAKVKQDMPGWDDTASAGGPRQRRTPSGQRMGFDRVIKAAGKTLLVMEPWHSPRLPTRVWCLFELYTTIVYCGADKVEVALGSKQQRGVQLELAENFQKLETAVEAIDAEQADATMPDDKINIFAAIRALPGGFDRLNDDIRAALRQWLLGLGDEVLARTDPERPLLTDTELAADAAQHGRWSAGVTRLVDRSPWLPELLVIVGFLGCIGFLGILAFNFRDSLVIASQTDGRNS